MDALGALNSLGTLSQLIPTLSFIGVYGAWNDRAHTDGTRVSVPTWKIGIASVSARDCWICTYNTGVATLPAATLLVSPDNIVLYPWADTADDGGTILFTNSYIEVKKNAQFTALLFNY